MPWQDQIAAVAGEMVRDDESGLWVPAYPEVTVTVPRQQGKTTLILAIEVDRSFNWRDAADLPVAQSTVYTAQTGSAARKKFNEDQAPIIRRSVFGRGVDRFYRAADNTGVRFSNGSAISVWSTADDAGHGETVGLGVLDEIFADPDDRREQAIKPAQLTVADSQQIQASTAGDEKSVFLERKKRAGRAAVESGKTTGTAYFEWSAPETADPFDPAVWWECMPALGYTITERTVADALETMQLDEFKRAMLNIPKSASTNRVIPAELWEAVAEMTPPTVDALIAAGGLALAVDVPRDRSAAAVVVASKTGYAELIEYRPGLAWVVDRLAELSTRLRAPVAVDTKGPAASLIDDLETAGVDLVKYTTADLTRACGRLWDGIADQKIAVRPSPALDDAVAGAAQRQTGDAWLWSRNTIADPSPLVALTMAVDAAATRTQNVDLLANIW